MRRQTGVVLLFFTIFNIGLVNAVDGADVSFWRETFKMTYPKKGSWFQAGKIKQNGTEMTLKYDETNRGLYKWQSGDNKYYFYVEGKVCDNCFELDGLTFLAAIVVDVLFTVVLMVVVYRCGRGKRTQKSTSSGGRVRPTPSPLYEGLSPHTRSDDPYSMRTG